MKKTALIFLLSLAFLPQDARAQVDLPTDIFLSNDAGSASAMVPTPPGQIAVIWHRLAGKQPDIAAWARETDAYKAANDFDKAVVLQQESNTLYDLFRLTTPGDPITVEMQAQMSAYSLDNKGFMIENLTPDIYFPYAFLNQNYAMVAPGAIDYQWVDVPDEIAAMKIDTVADQSEGRQLTLVLSILPVSADGLRQMTLDNVNYWLLSGNVTGAALKNPVTGEILWERLSQESEEVENSELKNLYTP